ncbi:hypothetical protein [Ruminococcus sp. Marseille-P6503]|uniref:hypothetical protein n=1 Tax=Ruminococcus sp. Marseille-P6503 TaxID=2364796 RepID=UPI000F53803D|nr:hypothetical protein [Ruminococcus sp. Marseille-P6503]
MKKFIKKITVFTVTILTMCATVINASAYTSSRLGETNKSTSSTRRYISCYQSGSFSYGNVSGTAWTKTSVRKSTFNPDCSFNGDITVTAGVGSVSGYKNNPYASSAVCNISGKASGTVKSSHVFSSATYGKYSTVLPN